MMTNNVKRSLFVLLLMCGSGFAIAADEVASKQASKEKQNYLNKADKEVQDLSSKIESAEKRSVTDGKETRQDLDRHFKAIHEGLDAVRKRLDEIRGASESAWRTLRAGVDRTLADVKHHYQKVVNAAPAAVKK